MRMTGVLQPRFANFPKVREHHVAIHNMIIVLQHHNMSLYNCLTDSKLRLSLRLAQVMSSPTDFSRHLGKSIHVTHVTYM